MAGLDLIPNSFLWPFPKQQMGGAGPLGPRPFMHPMGMPGTMPPGAPMYPYPFPPHMAPAQTVPPPQGYVTPGPGSAASDPRYSTASATGEPKKTEEEDQQLERYLAGLQQQQHRR